MARRKKRLHFVHVLILLPFALVIDLISLVISVIGSITVGIFALIFWLMGIRGKGVGWGFAITAGIELLPVISILPGVSGYVLAVYFMGRASEELSGTLSKEGESAEKDSVLRERNRIGGGRASVAKRRAKAIATARERRGKESDVFDQDEGREGRAERAKLRQRPTVQSGLITGAKPAKREASLLGGPARLSSIGGANRFSENRERLERAERSKEKQKMMSGSENLKKAA